MANKPIIKVAKSSDRRLAGSTKAASFLHSVSGKVTKPGTKAVTLKSTDTATGDSDLKTVKRTGGGKSWEDSTLLEWNPKHYRLFVGNLGPDANDQLLADSFMRFGTMTKVKVPIDNKTGKNKGFGFVAFEDAEDYFRAFKEMNGKYVGQHPVQLKRAETALKVTKKSDKRSR